MTLLKFSLQLYLVMVSLPPEVISGSLEHDVREGCELRRIVMPYEHMFTTSEPFLQLVLGTEFITRPMLLVRGQYYFVKHYLDFDSLMWRHTMASVKFHLSESPVRAEVHTLNLGTKTAYFEKRLDVLKGNTRELWGMMVWTTAGNCTSDLPYQVLSQENGIGFNYRLFPEKPMEYFIISKDNQSAGRLRVGLYYYLYDLCWDEELETIRLQETNSTEPCPRLPALVPHRLTFVLSKDRTEVKVNGEWFDVYIPQISFSKDGDTEGEYTVVYCLFKCPEEYETATAPSTTIAPPDVDSTSKTSGFQVVDLMFGFLAALIAITQGFN